MTQRQYVVDDSLDPQPNQYTARVLLLNEDGTPWTGGDTGPVVWSDVTGKPTTFPPATHTHTIANVTGLQTAIDAKLSATEGAAVANATDDTDVVAQLNALLASLRAAGVISA